MSKILDGIGIVQETGMRFPDILKKKDGENINGQSHRILELIKAPKINIEQERLLNEVLFGQVIRLQDNAFLCRVISEYNNENEILYPEKELKKYSLGPGDYFIRALAMYRGEYYESSQKI